MTPTTLTKPLGELLNWPTNHHFFNFPVFLTNQTRSDHLHFALLFELDGDPKVVATATELGYSDKWQSASYFTIENLVQGLTLVPLSALTSCQLIGLASTNLSRHHVSLLYPQAHLPKLDQAPRIYNPYRDAYDSKSSQTELTDYHTNHSERDYEEELQAFDLNKQGGFKPLTLRYEDRKRGQITKIFARGWYLFDNQPPLQISWKPAHTRKASWRSSHIGIDKKTGDYFFRGALYKGRQSPIFLKDLTFARQQVSQEARKNWQKLLTIIDQQKQAYLASQSDRQ